MNSKQRRRKRRLYFKLIKSLVNETDNLLIRISNGDIDVHQAMQEVKDVKKKLENSNLKSMMK